MRFQWKARLHGKLVSMVSSFSRLLCGWLCGSVIVAFMLHLVIMQPMSVKFFSWLFAIFMIAKLLSRRFIRLEQMFYCSFLFNVFIFLSDSSECDVPVICHGTCFWTCQ